MDNVHEWLEKQESDTGHKLLSDAKIVASVVKPESSESSEGENEMPMKREKVSTLCDCVDKLIDYTT